MRGQNYLSLPQVDQQVQRFKANEFAMKEAGKASQRTDQEWDDEQRLKNTRWLAGASKVGMEAYDKDPQSFMPAMQELTAEGVRRGLLDPNAFDLENTDPAEIRQSLEGFYNKAMVGLGGQPTNSQMYIDRNAANMTGPQKNYDQRNQLVQQFGENSPQVQKFDAYVRSTKITDIAGVPSAVGVGGVEPLSTQQDELDFARAEAQAKEEGGRAGRPSTAVTKVDEAFAKEYIDLTAGGALTDAQKAVSQLDQVYSDLSSGEKDLSGTLISLQPRAVLAITNPDALDARDQVEEVVQRNLRLILGAQFTEREGVRLIERAYNPALDESYNAIRVGRLFDQIRSAAKFKLAMVRHYEQNGTLEGFELSKMPDMEDFWKALQFQQGDVVKGYRFLGGDAANRDNWQRVYD